LNITKKIDGLKPLAEKEKGLKERMAYLEGILKDISHEIDELKAR